MYLQIVILLAVSIMIQFTPAKEKEIVIGILSFIVLQVAIQGAKGFENPDAVYYRKSCVMALVDFLSMWVFVIVAGATIWVVFFGGWWVNPAVLISLFVYIAFRKLYIIKNYSYEIWKIPYHKKIK